MAPRSLVLLLLCLAGCTASVSDFDPDQPEASSDGGATEDGGSAADGGSLEPVTVETGMGAGLSMPAIGEHELRIISPTVLELARIVGKSADPARVDAWDFVDEATGQLNGNMPGASAFTVTAGGSAVVVESVGFKRRARYAPVVIRDLRIEASIFLKLSAPISDGAEVEVSATGLWPTTMKFVAKADPLRLSGALHVNQTGYSRVGPKRAKVGCYLGSLGELSAPTGVFHLRDARSGEVVFEGTLSTRTDDGYQYTPKPYQSVREADFSAFQTAGEYRLEVPGLGASYPFSIDDGLAAAFARTYALGLLHQRCGAAKELPFTRFVSKADHVEPALVPDASSWTWSVIASESSDFANHQASGTPQLKDFGSMLYPFVRTGKIDVHGGHHDAGDYSKYTINSAALVHVLTFAADAFSGVAALDNLGLPESGDGKSDVLQLAKWEADFLMRMQDDDGGFYFLVYPRTRRYEGNVAPEDGDGQLVWPKTTSVTAAATAALAQLSSSPTFKAQFPAEAAAYLAAAKKGWAFLDAAITAHGKDGAYQKITHYGNAFRHDDELVWAAVELFLATGDDSYHQKAKQWMPDPSSDALKQWGWIRLFDAYGNAIRSYAFAAKTGRVAATALDAAYLAKCQSEVKLAGKDQLDRANASAYGTSFPLQSKAFMVAGWYFAADNLFDLAAAYSLEPSDALLGALVSNVDYEAGANPVNVSYLTGTGWKRPREIVHQWANTDHRTLPMTGIPQGNVQAGFQYLGTYGSELGKMSFPMDGASTAPYPFYDRWGDSWNVTTEFVVPQQGRGLGALAMWMAMSGVKDQSWRSANASIKGVPATTLVGAEVTATIDVPDLELGRARIVWDGQGLEPAHGPTFTFKPTVYGPQTLEAEAYWPDGRRVHAAFDFTAQTEGVAGKPEITVAATTPIGTEAGPANAVVRFTRTGDTSSALTVRYSLFGSAAYQGDYDAINGNYWYPAVNTLTFNAGEATADITVRVLDDTFTEPDEQVLITLLVDGAYTIGSNGRAVVTIKSDD